MRIGIIVAMDKEFAQLQTLATDKAVETHDGRTFIKGRIGANEVVMQQCGIGKVNSAMSLFRLTYVLPVFSIGLHYSSSEKSFVDRYLSPVSGSSATIVLPAFSSRFASSLAA